MKRIIALIISLAALVSALHGWGDYGSKTTTVSVSNNDGYSEIYIAATPTTAAQNANDIYTLTVTNGSSIIVSFEFEAGHSFGPYISDDSTYPYFYIWAQNLGDAFYVDLGSLPSGSYDVTLTGPGAENTGALNVYVY